MKQNYECLEINIICLDMYDVITTSDVGKGENDFQDPFGEDDEGGVSSWK